MVIAVAFADQKLLVTLPLIFKTQFISVSLTTPNVNATETIIEITILTQLSLS